MTQLGTGVGTTEAASRGGLHPRAVVLLLAALVVASVALAPRAEAFVYWTNGDSSIGRANLDGSAANPSFIPSSSPTSGAGVAVNDTHIYWANLVPGAGGSGDTYTDSIARANLDGTAVDQHFIELGADGNPQGVAVDESHIFWANQGTGSIARA